MSQENVEIMRRVVERWNRRDLEGVIALLAADIECFPAADQPGSESFRGREAFAEYAKGWLAAFDTYIMEADEYLDLGECVVVVGRVVGRGRESGAQVSAEDAWLYRLRGGEIIEYRECGTKSNALKAAGLRE
jgi:ketosteroid isomerase-like protein